MQLSDVAISDYLYLTQVRLLSIFATHSLTHSRFGDLTDVILAFEDANSKLIHVFSVADGDGMEHVDISSVKI